MAIFNLVGGGAVEVTLIDCPQISKVDNGVLMLMKGRDPAIVTEPFNGVRGQLTNG